MLDKYRTPYNSVYRFQKKKLKSNGEEQKVIVVLTAKKKLNKTKPRTRNS